MHQGRAQSCKDLQVGIVLHAAEEETEAHSRIRAPSKGRRASRGWGRGGSPREGPAPKPRPPEVPPPRHDRKCASPPQDGARNPEVSAAAAKLGKTEAPRAPRPAGPGSEVRRARLHPWPAPATPARPTCSPRPAQAMAPRGRLRPEPGVTEFWGSGAAGWGSAAAYPRPHGRPPDPALRRDRPDPVLRSQL